MKAVALRAVVPTTPKVAPSTLRSTENPASRPPSTQVSRTVSAAVALAVTDVGGHRTVTMAAPEAQTPVPSRRQRITVWRLHSERKPCVAMHAAMEPAHARQHSAAEDAAGAHSTAVSDTPATATPNRRERIRMSGRGSSKARTNIAQQNFRVFAATKSSSSRAFFAWSFSSGRGRRRIGARQRDPEANAVAS